MQIAGWEKYEYFQQRMTFEIFKCQIKLKCHIEIRKSVSQKIGQSDNQKYRKSENKKIGKLENQKMRKLENWKIRKYLKF